MRDAQSLCEASCRAAIIYSATAQKDKYPISPGEDRQGGRGDTGTKRSSCVCVGGARRGREEGKGKDGETREKERGGKTEVGWWFLDGPALK